MAVLLLTRSVSRLLFDGAGSRVAYTATLGRLSSSLPSSPDDPLVVSARRLSVEGVVEDGEGFVDAHTRHPGDWGLLLLEQREGY